MRQTIREILEEDGHEILEAPDGESGIDVQRRNHVDLVITDIFMPHKEGMSTIRELTAEFPGLSIVAMSGGHKDLSAPEGFIDLARRFGAIGTLTKPFRINDLRAVVAEALSNK